MPLGSWPNRAAASGFTSLVACGQAGLPTAWARAWGTNGPARARAAHPARAARRVRVMRRGSRAVDPEAQLAPRGGNLGFHARPRMTGAKSYRISEVWRQSVAR